MKKYALNAAFSLLALVLAACSLQKNETSYRNSSDAVICHDLAMLPQNLVEYALRVGHDRTLLSKEAQKKENIYFKNMFFTPWEPSRPLPSADIVFEGLRHMSPAKGFAQNLRPHDASRWASLRANCAENAYGSQRQRPAITVRETHLRRLPSDEPYFLNPDRPGQGFPFDLMQSSVLWIGTPVTIVHTSHDAAWVFVASGLVSGWTQSANLAVVDKAFMDLWKALPLGAVIDDSAVITVQGGKTDTVTGQKPTIPGKIGTILPFAHGNSAKYRRLHIPFRTEKGTAGVSWGILSQNAVHEMPLPLTPGNVALVGQGMMGQLYGWGGLYGQRDCSAAMRDIFIPFGVWLPRNSSQQAASGVRVDLDGLTPDEKEIAVLTSGIPFFSLITMNGHIGLYIGSARVRGKETPVMFHNFWGLRIINPETTPPLEGRIVIGKAVVTTLRPGIEHPHLASPAGLLDRINGITQLSERRLNGVAR